jgi:voltage-gated potassium channel
MTRIYRRLSLCVALLLVVLAAGAFGYRLISGCPLLDCLYITAITVTTIGFREVVSVENSAPAMFFTMFIAFSGIGIMAYTMSVLTALIVEGEILQTYRRKRMEKMIAGMTGHYLVCGVGETGSHIAMELAETQRKFVLVDKREQKDLDERLADMPFVQGDATDEKILLKAGLERATGVFAATNDNNYNLVIVVTAKQLKPQVRVVARSPSPEYVDRMKRVGADAVVSPAFIGGLRLASEMVRPTVVSFLDTMLRDKQGNLRIEEIAIPESYNGKRLSDLRLHECGDLLLLALRGAAGWVFNPPDDVVVTSGVRLVLMVTPEAMRLFEARFSGE